jgi:HEAT repeat protein
MIRTTLAILAAALALPPVGATKAQDPTPPARPARPERPAPAPRAEPAPVPFDHPLYAPMLATPMPTIAPMPAMAPMAPMLAMAPMAPMPAIAPMDGFDMPFAYVAGDRFDRMSPPAAWAQGDPADSVYRAARETFNRGEYGRAAQLFADISSKYPKSVYTQNAIYYEAFSRYKLGTTEELKTAAKVLEPIVGHASSNNTDGSNTTVVSFDGRKRNMSESDVSTLYTRINGALAQRGDREAAAKVEKFASQNGGAVCDNDDIQVRTEALNALSQMDPASALPMLRKVIERKDECTAPLRRNAIFMLGRRGDAESAALIATVAKSDPDANVRNEAISFLARQQGDAGLATLEEILKTEQDERIQRSAVHAIMSSDSPRARASLRALIERKDAPITLRIEAVNSYNTDRATADDAAYLRGYYTKADNDRLRDAILGALARIGGTDNDHWLLSVASNQNETSQLRGAAIARLYRSSTISVADLGKLYDSADSYNLRRQIIGVLQQRKEAEATDKLVDIVKNSTDTGLRQQALYAISAKKDPRSAQLLMDIIDGPKKP